MPANFDVRKMILLVGVLGLAIVTSGWLLMRGFGKNLTTQKIVKLEIPVVTLSSDKSMAWITAKIVKKPYIDSGVGYIDLAIMNDQYNTYIYTRVAIDMADKTYNFSPGTIQGGSLSSKTVVRNYQKLSFTELAALIKNDDVILIGLSLNRPTVVDQCNTPQCTKMANYITYTNSFVLSPTNVISEKGRMQIDTLAVATQFELQKQITQ